MNGIKVQNVRIGFATNSSSSHSIVFAPNLKLWDDYTDFGWDDFILTSTEAKKKYLATMLVANLEMSFPYEFINVILQGLDLPAICNRDYTEYSIDHQSVYNMPKEFGSDKMSIEFFTEFRNRVLTDGVHVFGGNDNDDTADGLFSYDRAIKGNWDADSLTNYTCRKDGDWWTLFSPTTGARVVVSFVQDPKPYKPESPLLVDLKITNFCKAGCAYCYQGSTKDGKHASPTTLYSFIDFMKNAKVFEVAIGGGEPTEHPYFVYALKQMQKAGILANFTTKSLEWLKDRETADKILPLIGAFAYSAVGTSEASTILSIFKERGYPISKFNIQVIPAILSEDSLEKILEWGHANRINVTLLGYKETGRGSSYKGNLDESKWLDILRRMFDKCTLGKVGIDTTLASKYGDALEKIGIPKWLYHKEEGEFSMYFDAVENMYGPSSYHTDKLCKLKGFDVPLEQVFAEIKAV